MRKLALTGGWAVGHLEAGRVVDDCTIEPHQ